MRASSRRAATIARSQLAAAARLAEEDKHRFDSDSKSDSEAEEHPCKLARVSVADRPRPSSIQTPEWYVAIDFGTTFTTVASHRRGEPTDRINTINDFLVRKHMNRRANKSRQRFGIRGRVRVLLDTSRQATFAYDLGLKFTGWLKTMRTLAFASSTMTLIVSP